MSTTPLWTSVTLAFIISSFLWRWRPRCRQFCLIDNGNGMNYNFMSLIQFKRCPVRSAAARARPLSSNQIPAQTKYYFNGSPTAGGQQQPSTNKVSAALQCCSGETRDTSLAMLQELLQVKLGNRPKLQAMYVQHTASVSRHGYLSRVSDVSG